ncbi:MAG: Gfo/Idh/MocA family oxidoreductase [Candidatus Nealsonbacteria bacterium]|nr:Gfo/Idh/MocA family oxidoreductase [Candidatus Nealsonbacteria bacterium]
MASRKQTKLLGRSAVSRRRFLAAAAAVSIVPRHVLGGPGRQPPSETLNVAGVGLGAIGSDNVKASAAENVVALCDVDSRMASVTFGRYPKAARYTDFRRMLDKQRDIDAVIVATPDHTHAVITAAAMRRGKHVYTQMPLAHSVWEARQLTELARQTGVATQMGNERYSAPTVRSVCEWIWAGCIGPVREVHCWTNRPQWPQGMNRPDGKPAVPSHFDWDLWLGPAADRPYHGEYHPYNWRGWRDFGTGALGAMGCHVMDGAFWALKLGQADAFSVEADSVGLTDASYAKASTVRYRFPARGDMPPVKLVWYDGGRRPPRPKEFPETREFLGSNGTIFVGEKGMLTFGALTAGTGPGQAGPRFIPESLRQSFEPPKATLPRIKAKDRWFGRHVQEWIAACKGGPAACSRFEIAGPLSEIVLLGNVALLSGKPIAWDRRTMKIAGQSAENGHLRRAYRDGWSL